MCPYIKKKKKSHTFLSYWLLSLFCAYVFLFMHLSLCNKTQGLRAKHKHNQNMHISTSAVNQDSVVTTVPSSALWFAVWGTAGLSAAERDFEIQVDSCLFSDWQQEHQIRVSSLQPDPPSVPARVWIVIFRAASFSPGAWGPLSWQCWNVLTAGIALQVLWMFCIIDY